MIKKGTIGLYLIVLMLVGAAPVLAQKQLVSTVDFEDALIYYRPRVALADNGAYAVAWEALRKLDDDEEWQIGLRRFDVDGLHDEGIQYLTKETFCRSEPSSGRKKNAGKNLTDDDLRSQFVEEGLRNVDMDFSEDGLLIVSTEQFRRTSGFGKEPRDQSSGMRVSLLDAGGENFSLNSDAACAWDVSDPMGSSQWPPYDTFTPPTPLEGANRLFNTRPTLSARTISAEPDTRKVAKRRAWAEVAGGGLLDVSGWTSCASGSLNDLSGSCEIDRHLFAHFRSNRQSRPFQHALGHQNSLEAVVGYRPSVAVNPIGRSVVVWIDYRQNDSGAVFGQVFDALGRPTGENFKVSADGGEIDREDGSQPEVAILDDGRFLVVWTEVHGGVMQAKGRYFKADGHPEAKPFLLDPYTEKNAAYPHVASNGSQFAYTWIVDDNGETSIFVNIPGVTDAVDVPSTYADPSLQLRGYPNPFTSETTIEYNLEESGYVTLTIFDLLGREVKTLVDERQAAGSYSVTLEAEDLAAGYYVTQLQQGNRQQSQLLVRTE